MAESIFLQLAKALIQPSPFTMPYQKIASMVKQATQEIQTKQPTQQPVKQPIQKPIETKPFVNPYFVEEGKRKEVTVDIVQPDGSVIKRKIKPQYSQSQDIKTFTKENPIEFSATYYNPDDKSQTSPTSTGRSPYTKELIDWGQVGRSNYGIPYGKKIFVEELNQTFDVTDSKNEGYSSPGFFSFDFGIRTDNPKRTELEELIANNPKMHFHIVE